MKTQLILETTDSQQVKIKIILKVLNTYLHLQFRSPYRTETFILKRNQDIQKKEKHTGLVRNTQTN